LFWERQSSCLAFSQASECGKSAKKGYDKGFSAISDLGGMVFQTVSLAMKKLDLPGT
jgi:hypothetical protein